MLPSYLTLYPPFGNFHSNVIVQLPTRTVVTVFLKFTLALMSIHVRKSGTLFPYISVTYCSNS
ncbi:uncharacterized protein BT62DRAFT_930981 [Guyanagaster necrorhizus]|uniref:Uncharacterized protein n=1 Tax=Guyanagaster necrorhizus TaxID=856835 RepID=A0A9P8ATM0_9AGAR|nr:uncharacterized protein BT62DRAFT_930981 [Guyanagaster necrorhizus MCA 3950]KAG7447141.1 hypothetical protein BT62DRAFT_930981 [Guyanagaster necrorhizus MCA 3950]